jgi:hypothetical protein
LIGKCSSIVLGEPLRALAKRSELTLGRPDPREYACHQKGRRIKRIVERNFHFCARSQQFDFCRILIRPIVRENPNNVILARWVLSAILLKS